MPCAQQPSDDASFCTISCAAFHSPASRCRTALTIGDGLHLPPSLMRRGTPVHRHDGAGDERRSRRAQEHGGSRDVDRLSPASERRPREDGRAAPRIVLQRLRELRCDPARRNGIDANSIRCVRNCQRFRELRDSAFARAVAGDEPATEEREHRRRVDDATRCLREQRPGGGAEAHRAGQVDVQHFGEHRRIVLGAAADDRPRN